jgi:hypothetical protein
MRMQELGRAFAAKNIFYFRILHAIYLDLLSDA